MMNVQTVDNYIILNQKYFPGDKILFLKERLYAMDEQRFSMLSTVELKDPVVILIISIFLGGLGIDRFMIGDIGLGVLKLLTFRRVWYFHNYRLVFNFGKNQGKEF